MLVQEKIREWMVLPICWSYTIVWVIVQLAFWAVDFAKRGDRYYVELDTYKNSLQIP